MIEEGTDGALGGVGDAAACVAASMAPAHSSATMPRRRVTNRMAKPLVNDIRPPVCALRAGAAGPSVRRKRAAVTVRLAAVACCATAARSYAFCALGAELGIMSGSRRHAGIFLTTSEIRMTLRLLLLGTAMAASAMTTSFALAAPHGFTVEDMVGMERVGSPVLSPDASKLVYTVRSTNLDKNRGNTQLWMIDLRAAKPVPVRLTQSDASSTDPEWSPSGDEAAKVTDLPLDVDNFRLSPQGDRIAMSLAVYRDCADLACTKSRLDEKAKTKSSGQVYDHEFVRHWDTWSDGRNAVLYSAPIDSTGRVSAAPVSLTGSLDGDVPSKPYGDHEEYHFSPDGKTIVFAARIAGKSEAWSTNFDVYTVAAAGGATV